MGKGSLAGLFKVVCGSVDPGLKPLKEPVRRALNFTIFCRCSVKSSI
jgi:hypothetical protein